MRKQELFEGLKLGLELKASSQNTKYYVNDVRRFESFVADLVETTTKVMAAGRNHATIIDHNGEENCVNDYTFPKSLVAIINANKVYYNAEAVGVADPYFTVTCEDWEKTDEDLLNEEMNPEKPESKQVKHKPRVLSVHEVAAFFRRWNGNQPEDDKLLLEDVEFSNTSLDDYQELVASSEGYMVSWRPSGESKISGNVAKFVGLKAPVDDKYVNTVRCANKEERALWLLKA